jgi:hypothetical protein
MQPKKMELKKVKGAKEQANVAYIKNKKALITKTKVATSK